MKRLLKSHFDFTDERLFNMSLNSNSITNIRVGDRLYGVDYLSDGKYLITEFITEFELTEEEFKIISSKR